MGFTSSEPNYHEMANLRQRNAQLEQENAYLQTANAELLRENNALKYKNGELAGMNAKRAPEISYETTWNDLKEDINDALIKDHPGYIM